MNREELVELFYYAIKCNGKTPGCIGQDCHLCMANKLADCFEIDEDKQN